jgi:hypothetical protein
MTLVLVEVVKNIKNVVVNNFKTNLKYYFIMQDFIKIIYKKKVSIF